MPDSEPRTPEGIARQAPTAHPVDSVAAQLTQKKQDQPSVSPRVRVDESKTAARQEDAQARREARAQAAESAREERRQQYELRQAERKQRAQERAQALAARRAQND